MATNDLEGASLQIQRNLDISHTVGFHGPRKAAFLIVLLELVSRF
jgi:hypothetical protein